MPEKHPVLYELIDKDGKSHGDFPDVGTAAAIAKMYWPDQEQDEDRAGKGWDIQVVGS